MHQLIVALTLLGSALAIMPAQSTAAAPPGTYYVMSTVSVVPRICTGINCDTFSTQYDYSGDGSCLGCLPPSPIRGAFSLSLFPNRFLPPNPVMPKSGIGTLTVLWADSTMSTTVDFAFKARDSKVYWLSGEVTGGFDSPFAAGTDFGGLVGLPPNPIEPGETFAAISFG